MNPTFLFVANFVDVRICKTADLIGGNSKKKKLPQTYECALRTYINDTFKSLFTKVAKFDSHVYIHVQTKMLEVFTAILVPEQYCYTSNVVHKCFNNMVSVVQHS